MFQMTWSKIISMFVKVINLVTHPISETEGDDANKPLNEKDDKDFG